LDAKTSFERVSAHLERRRDWLLAYEARLASQRIDLQDEEAIERILEESNQFTRAMKDFDREARGLRAEWSAVEPGSAAAAWVAAMNEELLDIAQRGMRLLLELQVEADNQMLEISTQQRALSRGRGMLKNYNPLENDTPDYMDRKG